MRWRKLKYILDSKNITGTCFKHISKSLENRDSLRGNKNGLDRA